MDFKGQSDDALFEYMGLNFSLSDVYARYCTIGQSSGMGKSRLVDQLSKKYLVVPICLCMDDETGIL